MLSRDTFANPPSKYRPIPFWFWNSKMRKERVEEQIRDFHAKGIGGFFIHARFGLETDYLSREWMECISRSVKVAEELGMEVWLYDENGFPSGIGDLKVSRVPEYRSKFIDVTEATVESGQKVELELPRGEVMMAYAYRQGSSPSPQPSPARGEGEGNLTHIADPLDRDGPLLGGEGVAPPTAAASAAPLRSATEATDLTDSIHDDRLAWTVPAGEWNVVVYSKCVLEDPNDVIFGVDYLNPEAMRYFFDFTFAPYEKAVGEYFGKTIKGIFTDEPTLLPWHHDINWYLQRKHRRVVVWDDLIEQEMKSRVKLDARAFLPHLFFDIDDTTPQVRRAFWQTVSDLYMRAFFVPYSKWCEEHNLKLTGHVLFEEGLYLNTDFQADVAASLSVFHVPGTDHLAEMTESPYGGWGDSKPQLTNLQGEKLVASIAHLNGREAAITETYGCAGWGLSFERMKWIADWQYSLGLNMLCPHAVFYSIEGFRKSDAPPSENHMAGWPHYRAFGDYIGRLSYALREGRHVAKIALFYPLREFWGQHIVGREGEDDRVTSDSFDLCASLLPRLHFDYDIIPEQSLASASVEDGKLRIGDEGYEVLIAPPFAMEGKAREVVQRFVEAGGAWVLPPSTRGETEREQIGRELHLLQTAMGKEASEDARAEFERQWPARARHIVLSDEVGKLIAVLAGTSDPDGVSRGLDAALREAISPDIEIRSADGGPLPDVRYVHRESGGKHILFLANTSDRTASAVICSEITGAAEEWDLESGEVRPANGPQLVEGQLHLRHNFAPCGSALYVIDPDRPVQSRPRAEPEREELMALPDEWRFRIEGPNALVLGRWTFEPRVHGAGEDYTYSAVFRCEHVPEKLLLMLDDVEYRASLMGGMHLEMQVNDRTWRRPDFGWYLDPGMKTLDIAEAVTLGENNVKIIIRHSAWSGQPHLLNAPPVLLGDFACNQDTSTLLPPVTSVSGGSWGEFGYPFYSGTAVYSQSFRAPKPPAGARMIVSVESVRDMVEITVNGQSAAVRLWQPWEADVTGLVQDGENELQIKVTNSMANFLEANARPSGLLGRVRIVAEP